MESARNGPPSGRACLKRTRLPRTKVLVWCVDVLVFGCRKEEESEVELSKKPFESQAQGKVLNKRSGDCSEINDTKWDRRVTR